MAPLTVDLNLGHPLAFAIFPTDALVAACVVFLTAAIGLVVTVRVRPQVRPSIIQTVTVDVVGIADNAHSAGNLLVEEYVRTSSVGSADIALRVAGLVILALPRVPFGRRQVGIDVVDEGLIALSELDVHLKPIANAQPIMV